MKTADELTCLFVHAKAKLDRFIDGGQISVEEVCSTVQRAASEVSTITGKDQNAVEELLFKLMDSEADRQTFYRQYGIKIALEIA